MTFNVEDFNRAKSRMANELDAAITEKQDQEARMSQELPDAKCGMDRSEPASDEVIDAIADIEMQRRETVRAAGFAMSCSSALHRLNELLAHETEALRLRGADSAHRGNIQAVSAEIARVKALNGGGAGAAAAGGERPGSRSGGRDGSQ